MSILPPSFLSKKSKILESLSVPIAEYDDLSPKGSIDIGIRELIDEINGLEGCVTTSSCAGRISVFLEGRKNTVSDGNGYLGNGEDGEGGERGKVAGVGGKGGGGRWLFVSHDPVDVAACGGMGGWVERLGMERVEGGEDEVRRLLGSVVERRLVHFKFEPMVCIYPVLYGTGN